VSIGGPPEDQLFLLPARTAAEASTWGSAVIEYAASFHTVHFARDPERVDWRGYQRVTIVEPTFWPDDLELTIKQSNPDMVIDRIPVNTPEALQAILNVRVYYGWRFGPQTEFDWAQLWPYGKSLIGLHGRSSGELEGTDYAVVRSARVEAIKITTHATLRTVERLQAINPDTFFMIRPFASFGTTEHPRHVTPQEFVEWTTPDLERLLNFDSSLRYIEIHNEPNIRLEGLGGSWNDGYEFGRWFLEVLHLYRQRFPQCQYGFPGLSPGPQFAAGGRYESELFLSQCLSAAQQADWVGLHAYWVNEREMADQALGLGFARYRSYFPEKLLFITEFGNPNQPKAVVADQYARYYALLRNVPGLGGAFSYVVSTPDPIESPRWAWRSEAGDDVGIAAQIGRRQYIR
jgi:hypothetical protein